MDLKFFVFDGLLLRREKNPCSQQPAILSFASEPSPFPPTCIDEEGLSAR
jgi:hypothetical protein